MGYVGDSLVATPALLSPIIRSLFRLWCHENTRTYCDRLINDDQRYWFSSALHDVVMEHFCQGVEDVYPTKANQPLFPSKYCQKLVRGLTRVARFDLPEYSNGLAYF